MNELIDPRNGRAGYRLAGRSLRRIRFTIALALLWCSSHAHSYCLQYEAVDLIGTLVRQTYPGPPDYGSVTKGDEPRVILMLLLEHSVCVVDPDPR